MWQLHTEQGNKRIYRNSTTNSECVQNKCYTDKDGNVWWEFEDLFTVPFTRKFAGEKVAALYTFGLTPDDASVFFTKHKATLRGKDDGEKYDKAMAETLDFESKFTMATDPVKKLEALVCVYYTMNDEPIDSFNGAWQAKKQALIEADAEMHSFFLQGQIALTERSMNNYNQFLQTASPQTS